MDAATVERLAVDLLAAADGARLTPLPSASHPGFSLADGFAVGERLRGLRIARGERPVGWKIGFTNRSIWPRYGVYAPIWAPVWERTLQLLPGTAARVSLGPLCQPRIEPEIVFGFREAPRAGMDEAALLGCIAWVAHGIEIVQTHFADWKFGAADTVADGALHGRLFVGPRVPVDRWSDAGAAGLGADLAALRLRLLRDEVPVDEGVGANVLDGPLTALRTWIDAMAVHSPGWQVAPGEVVTTGTITDAWPLVPGQHWRTEPADPRLAGLALFTED